MNILRATSASLLPVAAALLVSGAVLLLVGVDPLTYYALVVERGLLSARGLQETITRTGPLMLLAAALLVSFRAGLWNLGTDGQYLLGALAAAACAPALGGVVPAPVALGVPLLLAAAAGALWAALPGWLRAAQGVNEVITSLMMNFLGGSLCAVLVKLVLQDPGKTESGTRTLAPADRLPHLFGSTISAGVPVALLVLLGVHLAITRTAWGLRLRILGASPAAALHAGIDVPRTIWRSFLASGALAGLAGGIDLVGSLGALRADWAPDYGLTVVPLVFLARLNGFAVALFIAAFSILSIGSRSAALRTGVPQSYNLALTGLLLAFMTLAGWLHDRGARAS